jgi:hypothetical protein
MGFLGMATEIEDERGQPLVHGALVPRCRHALLSPCPCVRLPSGCKCLRTLAFRLAHYDDVDLVVCRMERQMYVGGGVVDRPQLTTAGPVELSDTPRWRFFLSESPSAPAYVVRAAR